MPAAPPADLVGAVTVSGAVRRHLACGL